MSDTALAQRLREAREWLGLSQDFVAEQMRIPRASLSAIENGKRKVYTAELTRFAALYKRPIPSLLEEGPIIPDPQDETLHDLFRAVAELGEGDRQAVLRFAQFLRQAGRVPALKEGEDEHAAQSPQR